MSVVVLQPHSQTNSSDKYRVVDYDKWIAHTNGDLAYLPVVGEFSNYADALDRRNKINYAQHEA